MALSPLGCDVTPELRVAFVALDARLEELAAMENHAQFLRRLLPGQEWSSWRKAWTRLPGAGVEKIRPLPPGAIVWNWNGVDHYDAGNYTYACVMRSMIPYLYATWDALTTDGMTWLDCMDRLSNVTHGDVVEACLGLHGRASDEYRSDPSAASDELIAHLRLLEGYRRALSGAVYAAEDVCHLLGASHCCRIGTRGFARLPL